ncbi:MAG: YkgJ family cysteine cluster protein [Pseudomonadota bacterium]
MAGNQPENEPLRLQKDFSTFILNAYNKIWHLPIGTGDGLRKIYLVSNDRIVEDTRKYEMVDMFKKVETKFGPCIEKNCAYCCNPVKVFRFFPDDKIPTDEEGKKIWKEREETFIPKSYIDKVRLKTYDCIYFDKSTGKCIQYDKRPEICRKVSCIDENCFATIDEQHQKILDSEFIVVKPIRRYHE